MFPFWWWCTSQHVSNSIQANERSKSHEAKEKISQELSVLKWMQMEIHDKGTLPENLKYRDRGYMYFPHRSLLPFIKKA